MIDIAAVVVQRSPNPPVEAPKQPRPDQPQMRTRQRVR
jgi:hypothetical protein